MTGKCKEYGPEKFEGVLKRLRTGGHGSSESTWQKKGWDWRRQEWQGGKGDLGGAWGTVREAKKKTAKVRATGTLSQAERKKANLALQEERRPIRMKWGESRIRREN